MALGDEVGEISRSSRHPVLSPSLTTPVAEKGKEKGKEPGCISILALSASLMHILFK